MGLKEWFDSQSDGAMTRMLWDLRGAGTPISWATICRAKAGKPISELSARIISTYTKGAVPFYPLTRKGQEEAEARARTAKRGRKRVRGRAA